MKYKLWRWKAGLNVLIHFSATGSGTKSMLPVIKKILSTQKVLQVKPFLLFSYVLTKDHNINK